MALYTVTIEVEVHDSEALFMAAMHHATKVEAMDVADSLELLRPDPDFVDVGECLLMLLNPDLRIAGADFVEVRAEATPYQPEGN